MAHFYNNFFDLITVAKNKLAKLKKYRYPP